MYPESRTAPAAAEDGGPAGDSAERVATGRGRRGLHWRKWLVLGLVLLGLRLALPFVVAPLLASRFARAFGTTIEIGDLSFQPIDAVFTLRRVTVHAPAGMPVAAAPPIVAKRVRVDVQWLPLLHQQLQVRELTLESARVDLDRFPDGGFGLANLERVDPAGALPDGWSFALDRIAVRDTELQVRNRASEGTSMLEATVRSAGISGIRRRPTAFGRAANLRVDALVGGGQLRVRGHYELRDDGLVLNALMRVKDVPLAQVEPYVADFGWTGVSGQVSGQLRWQREPRRRDLLSGRIVLRRGRVQVASLTEPALEVRRGVADIAAIDLLNRRITIESLILRGATLAVRPETGAPIPLMTTMLSRPPPRVGRQDASTRAAPAPRWGWMIERFDTTHGRLRVLAPDGPVDLRTQASGENLGPGAYWSPLRINIARQDTVAAFDGSVRLTHGVIVEGRLKASGLDVPSLARAAALPWAALAQTGRATADLMVRLDTATSDDFPFDARGDLVLTDLWICGADPGVFAVGAAAIESTLESFTPRAPPRANGRGGRPARISFSNAIVSSPYVLLTRTTDGWMLPPLAPIAGMMRADTPEIVVGDVRADDGHLLVVDMVPTPDITWDLTRANASAQRLSLPAFTFDGLQVHGSDPGFGPLYLGGSRRAGTNHFEVSGERVPLSATTPYLQLAGLPYHFTSGKASFTASGSVREAGWNADAALTLQAPALTGNDGLLQQAIGMPVASALALLRDQGGNVTLKLALASLPAGSRDTYAGQVAAGVRDTIHSNLTQVTTAAGRPGGEDFAPVNVLFSPGQAQLTMAAMQDLAPVAELLDSHPALIVELTAKISSKDQRWLAEQALHRRLKDSGGLLGMLRAFGMRSAYDRIQIALAARARGALGLLDAKDEALLRRLLTEAPPVRQSEFDALRRARLTHVANHLAEHYGIIATRVVVRSGDSGESETISAVRAQVTMSPDVSPARRGALPSAAGGWIESPAPAPRGLR